MGRGPAAPGRRPLHRDRDDGAATSAARTAALQTCCILHDLTGRLAIERELEELSARLLQLSRGDELTGLQNRRGLLASGTQLLQFADRQNAPVHALFVDVDNVQELNERLGHQAGDAALQAVARALSVTFRKNDVMARIGGTQFLVLTLHLAEPDCSAVTARIRSHLGAPETRQFVGAAVEVCCGWTTRQARRAHLARGPDGPLGLGHAGVPRGPSGQPLPGRRRLTFPPRSAPTRTHSRPATHPAP